MNKFFAALVASAALTSCADRQLDIAIEREAAKVHRRQVAKEGPPTDRAGWANLVYRCVNDHVASTLCFEAEQAVERDIGRKACQAVNPTRDCYMWIAMQGFYLNYPPGRPDGCEASRSSYRVETYDNVVSIHPVYHCKGPKDWLSTAESEVAELSCKDNIADIAIGPGYCSRRAISYEYVLAVVRRDEATEREQARAAVREALDRWADTAKRAGL